MRCYREHIGEHIENLCNMLRTHWEPKKSKKNSTPSPALPLFAPKEIKTEPLGCMFCSPHWLPGISMATSGLYHNGKGRNCETYCNTRAASTHVCQTITLFLKIPFWKWNIPKHFKQFFTLHPKILFLWEKWKSLHFYKKSIFFVCVWTRTHFHWFMYHSQPHWLVMY